MSGYRHAPIDAIRPDHPADSTIRVVAHRGDMHFVVVTSMTGPDENWCLQLDPDTAGALAESIRIAASAARRAA